MPTGVTPQDTLKSNPTDPLDTNKHSVVSPTWGGSGNHTNPPGIQDLDAYSNGTRKPNASKTGVITVF
jgi:hypothetical protein